MPAVLSKELWQKGDIKYEPKHKTDNENKNYVIRMHDLLKRYHENIMTSQRNTSINRLLLNYYKTKNIQQSNLSFMNDYNKYIQNIDNNTKQLQQHQSTCNVSHCKYIHRAFNHNNHNTSTRYKLYKLCKDELSLMQHQYFDRVHLIKYHLVDIGVRTFRNQENDTNLTNHGLKQRKNELIHKRTSFDLLINNKNTHNKFLTNVCARMDDTKNNDDYSKNISKYSFGVRFYYHQYYKHNTKQSEPLPLFRPGPSMIDGVNHFLNPLYRYCDWYIHTKYSSMKSEVLNSDMSLIQYKHNLIKAQQKLKQNRSHFRKPHHGFLLAYNIGKDQPISLNHILAIVLYTNNTLLCTKFSLSFRKISANESDNELKKRHSVFANWAKYLREAVEVYGDTLEERKIDVLYHGIASEMVFSGLKQNFCLPTSTTKSKDVAISFAAPKGIVISIKNTMTAAAYWNCLRYSDFPWEFEYLFIGGFQKLQINGLMTLIDDINYDQWIQCIQLFDNSLYGLWSSFMSTKEHVNKIKMLISYYLDNTKNKNEFPAQYISNLFKNICNDRKSVQFDVGQYDKNVCHANYIGCPQFGYPLLKSLYFDADNMIKLDLFDSLFPNTDTMYINSKKKIPNQINRYVWRPTIEITEEFLNQVLVMLKRNHNKWKDIVILKPIYSGYSLYKLKQKYLPKFESLGYDLADEENTDHPQLGPCDSIHIWSTNC
eukprot:71915_1